MHLLLTLGGFISGILAEMRFIRLDPDNVLKSAGCKGIYLQPEQLRSAKEATAKMPEALTAHEEDPQRRSPRVFKVFV